MMPLGRFLNLLCALCCISVSADSALEGYAVSCSEGFGELRDPKYFEVFGGWQSRYGRDSLRMSTHFLDVYQQHILPVWDEAISACPAFVLETMMNAVLKIDTDEGFDAARAWLLQIYALRDAVLAAPSSRNRERLSTLMQEWAVDIAAVYPKFFDIERLGPFPAMLEVDGLVRNNIEPLGSLPGGDHVEADFCMGQSFYVYTLDTSFYEPGSLYCLQGQWGTEVIMHHYLRHNCRTLDPNAADWFYVPLYSTCKYVRLNENVTNEGAEMKSMDSVSSEFIWQPLLHFLGRSKYYHRRQGRDHIFLFADGQGPRIWDSYDMLRGDSVFLSPESKCPTWNEAIRKFVDIKPCLTAWKDIIIPGHTDFARVQYMRKHNRPSDDRRLLMTFHGRSPGLHEAYGDCAVRQKIMDLSKHGPHVDVGGFVEDYPERKGDSHFCLVPAGTSPWTNHLYESFYAGCIPVILSDEYEVAFLHDLDWPSFSIKWPEAHVGDDLYRHLEDLVTYFPHRVMSMKASLERNACWFDWYSTDVSCSPYLLIQARLKKLLALRQSKPRFWNCDDKLGLDSGEPPLVFAHLKRPTRFKHFTNETSNFTYLTSAVESAA